MWLALFFLLKSLFFLLCVGVRYFVSNLERTLIILSTKASSFLSTDTGCFESSELEAEAVLNKIAESELGKLQGNGVEARIYTSMDSEVLMIASSKLIQWQLDRAKWYLLFMKTNWVTSFLSLSNSYSIVVSIESVPKARLDEASDISAILAT